MKLFLMKLNLRWGGSYTDHPCMKEKMKNSIKNIAKVGIYQKNKGSVKANCNLDCNIFAVYRVSVQYYLFFFFTFFIIDNNNINNTYQLQSYNSTDTQSVVRS